MPWLQLHATLSAAQSGEFESLLESLGAQSITFRDSEDQPILEPGVGETPLWPSIHATALFDGAANEAAIRQSLHEQFDATRLSCEFETLADRAWEREWLKHFAPIRCGKRLWVCPSGHEPPDKSAVNLLLDPGLAFGTGTHETTRMCLAWLDANLQPGTRVLDFGCGSGILGIAALLLGANHCSFTDNDPQALQATADNLLRNQLGSADSRIIDAADFVSGESTQFDVVLANILAGPLLELAPLLQASLAPGGRLVLSGLRAEQEDPIHAAYASTIEFEAPAELNGWLRLSGTRRPG